MSHHFHRCPDCGLNWAHDDATCPHFRTVQPSPAHADAALPPKLTLWRDLECEDHGGPVKHYRQLGEEWEKAVKASTQPVPRPPEV
jgi:hypothetical protein